MTCLDGDGGNLSMLDRRVCCDEERKSDLGFLCLQMFYFL